MKFSVVIPTYNRASDLAKTLASIAELHTPEEWEVIVVDNNSRDNTRAVIAEMAHNYPVHLKCISAIEQGRSAALNVGIQASGGDIILTTDDDVRVSPDWLDQAMDTLDEFTCDYVAGKVLPIWSADRPEWLPNRPGRHWAVIALLDYGPDPLELGNLPPLGVNMAFRRTAFARAGLWDNRLGRRAGTLLGQEVREWLLRAKAIGLRGFYAPRMVVNHVIPPERLKKAYFRRWFYWHGVSRALLYAQSRVNMEDPQETLLDYSKIPHIAGVPRYLYRSSVRTFFEMIKAGLRRDPIATFENELWLWFFLGIVKQRWRDNL